MVRGHRKHLVTSCFVSVTLLALASVWVAATPAYGEPPNLVIDPGTLRLSGVSGTNVSASFLVHVSNTSRALSIRSISATALQDNSGHRLPASSVSLASSNMTIGIGAVVTLTVALSIPAGALPGNYSGQVILFAENGSVTSAGLHVVVTPPLNAYLLSYGVIVFGVSLSFLYSPVGDKQNDKNRLSLARFDKARIRDHATVLVTAGILSGVAFSYFLTSSTDFGAMPLRDNLAAFLQGFLVHRGMDGLAGKIFK